MTEIYNRQVLDDVAKPIRADMVVIQETINMIRKNKDAGVSDFKATAFSRMCARVRSIAAKYGHDLTNWKGNDAPTPPEPTEDP